MHLGEGRCEPWCILPLPGGRRERRMAGMTYCASPVFMWGGTVCVSWPRFPLLSVLFVTTLKDPEPMTWMGSERVKVSDS